MSAPFFSPSGYYNVGDLVSYAGTIYRCRQPNGFPSAVFPTDYTFWAVVPPTSGNAIPAPVPVVTVGDTSVTVSWSAIAGASGYCFIGGVGSVVPDGLWVSASTLTYTFTGLTNGTSYKVQLATLNSLSTSPPQSVVPVGAGLPGTPIPKIEDLTSTGITVSCPPVSGDGPITYSLGVGTTPPYPQTPMTYDSLTNLWSASVVGLTPSTDYELQVTATNTTGSTPSLPTAFTTLSGGTPPSPPVLSAAAVGSTSMVLVCLPVAGDSPITYTLYFNISDKEPYPFSEPMTLDKGAYDVTLTSLTPSTTYYFYAIAQNAAGTAQSQVLVQATTDAGGPPGTPAPSASQVTQTTITVTCPLVTGSVPITYTLYLDAQPIPTTSYVMAVSGGSADYQVVGLAPATTYNYYVVAANSVSNSQSVIQNTQTLPGNEPPGTPSASASNVTKDSMTISASPVSGTEPIAYTAFFDTTNPPIASFPMTLVGGVWTYDATGLAASTSYSYYVEAKNQFGKAESQIQSQVTQSGAPPSNPVISVGAITGSSIIVTCPPVTGADPINYVLHYLQSDASSAPPAPYSNTIPMSLVGPVQSVTLSGLLPNTKYWLYIVATNANGSGASIITSATTSATSTTVPSYYIVTFLVFSNNQWLIDTASNPQLGNWLLTDGSQGSGGTIVGGAGAANVVSYLKGLQAQGCKILLSIGGAGADLATMFADSDGLAQAILGLLCGVAGVTGNPYNWKNTQFSDFAFDGIDLDLEAPAAGTPLPIASSAWSFSKSFQTYSTSKILTMAPESPYILGGTKSLLNFNGIYAAYSSVAPGTPLTSLNNQFEQLCPMFPNNNCLNRFDLMFIQIYNQGPGWYIGEDSFVTSLAMYGFMCLIAGRNCKVVIGLASADGNPVWDPTSVTAGSVTLNTAITSANALIQAIGGGYAATQPTDWLGGIGFWNSPSANAPMTAIYADNTLANLPANAGVLYCNNTANAQPPGWTGLIPLGRT